MFVQSLSNHSAIQIIEYMSQVYKIKHLGLQTARSSKVHKDVYDWIWSQELEWPAHSPDQQNTFGMN